MRPRSLIRLPRARLALSLLLSLCLAWPLAGCGKQAAKPAPSASEAAKPKPKAQAGPAAAPQQVYAYSAEGKVDPFRPFGVGRAQKEAQPQEAAPLRQMDVAQFKLVGIADSPGGKMALVQDGTGRGYILTPGMVVGASGGVVKEIRLDGVSVEEQVRDYAGRLQTKTVMLKLVQEGEK